MLPGVKIGPISNKVQYEKVQRLIQIGIDEGARLVAGGLGRPDGMSEGYFVKPTVFADVTNDMTIAREEIFCLLYTSPSPRDGFTSRMPSSA